MIFLQKFVMFKLFSIKVLLLPGNLEFMIKLFPGNWEFMMEHFSIKWQCFLGICYIKVFPNIPHVGFVEDIDEVVCQQTSLHCTDGVTYHKRTPVSYDHVFSADRQFSSVCINTALYIIMFRWTLRACYLTFTLRSYGIIKLS